jgi:nicotinate-nucleotide--dimethylbenzimidazole phosphoribosyltransferase
LIPAIVPIQDELRLEARERLDRLTKPIGSLGLLEDLAVQLYAVQQGRMPIVLNKTVYVFAADHGVAEEGVSAYPREVTYQMVLNFLREGSAINVLARLHGVKLSVIDVGVDADFEGVEGLIHRKVVRGTSNMLRGPAMSPKNLNQSLLVGLTLAAEAAQAGRTMIAIGEMGIGNTTSASSITCALTGAPVEQATGRGTGLSSEAYSHKIGIIRSILTKHFGEIAEPSALNILRRVGGLEIAAMVGMILGAAERRLIVVLDGFIVTAAAALAVAIVPAAKDYLIAGHRSEEPGHRILLDYLKLSPVLSLQMRLGEGTGAVLAMPIIESACSLFQQMATFSSAGVSGAL